MRTAVLCALVAAVLPLPARAQSISLTEADALARLSPDSPRLRAIRATVDLARADVLAAGRWPNPRLTWDRESVAGVTEQMLMVAQALPVTGRRGLEQQSAAAVVEAASNRADDAMRRARADLRLAFAQLVAAQAREQELTASRERLRELAAVLARREAAGDAAGFDRLRAEREVMDVDADRAQAASERARAQAAVAGFFAEAIDASQIVAAPAAAPPGVVPTLEELVARAEPSRGELLALRKDVEAARLAADAAGRRKAPEPEIVVGVKSSSALGAERGGVFAIQASLPVFDHGRPELAAATARAIRAEAQIDTFRLALRAEIAALRASVLERRGTGDRYRTNALQSAAEFERIARVSYDAGERGILELLDAYRSGSTARIRQAALDLALRQAEIELEFVSGWEMP